MEDVFDAAATPTPTPNTAPESPEQQQNPGQPNFGQSLDSDPRILQDALIAKGMASPPLQSEPEFRKLAGSDATSTAENNAANNANNANNATSNNEGSADPSQRKS